jgi:hypothetical protein
VEEDQPLGWLLWLHPPVTSKLRVSWQTTV